MSAQEKTHTNSMASIQIPASSPMRTRELELMHHYSTKTYLTFSATGVSSEIWKSFVIQEGLKYDFLIDGILGLSAIHIAVEGTDKPEDYVKCALEYQNRAFGSFRDALSNLNSKNCSALFAFSVIAMIGAIISTRIVKTGSDKSPTENILLVFELLEGVRFVSKAGRDWLKLGPFGPVFDLWFLPMSSAQDPSVKIALDDLMTVNGTMRLTRTEEQHATLTAAIEHLQTCFSKDKEMVLTWLAMSGKEFMSELRMGKPMAMLIFLHWGVLLNRLSDEWWVDDSGKRLVAELSTRLRECGEGWARSSIWARSQVGLSSEVWGEL